MTHMLTLGRRQAIAATAAGLVLPGSAMARTDRKSPIVTHIIVEDNRLWVAAAIGNDKPRLFCIDTGAPRNFLRPEIARALKLPIKGGQMVGGLGKNEVAGEIVAANDLVIGGTIRVPLTMFVLYDFGQSLSLEAAGLLAAGLFTSRDCDIDFAAGEWRLWPDGRPERPNITMLDSRFVGGDKNGLWSSKIEVTAYIAGKPYRLVCDTGSPGGILLFARTARANRLFDDTTPFALEPTGGFGGRAAKLSRVMRMGPFQLGPLTIDRPLVTVMDPDQSSHFGDHDGVIGLSLLQLFTLSTEAWKQKLWVSRNDRPLPPDRYRPAGLWLDRADDGSATVAVVGTGSPAAAAGLRAGDMIVDPPLFADAIRRTNQRPGTLVELGVKRDGAFTTARYTIQPYL